MPSSPTALLVHRPGPDRAAIADRLRRAGLEIDERDDAAGAGGWMRPPYALVAVQSIALFDASASDVDALRAADAVLLLEGDRAPAEFRRVLRAPFFIEDILSARRGAAEAERAAGDDDLPGELLRAVAHALSNRAQAADGWSALIAMCDPASRRRAEAETQLRAELSLLGRFAQGLALLGGRPIGGLGGGVADAAEAFALEVAARGGIVVRRGEAPRTAADPEALAVVAALLLADRESDLAPETRLEGSAERLRVVLPLATAELLPRPGERPSDILRRVKRTSALGVAVALRVASVQGARCTGEYGPTGPVLVMEFPAAHGAREADA
jgi:hypothetical protein